MKKTMMYLPDEMHGYLVREADERGVSMAEIAREAISQYRAAHESGVVRDYSVLIGIVNEPGEITDAASQVDEVLDGYFAVKSEWDQEHGYADRS
jgi:hypothetical protein